MKRWQEREMPVIKENCDVTARPEARRNFSCLVVSVKEFWKRRNTLVGI